MRENFNYHEYLKAARKPNGAILFTVMRGKLSEGVDFKDKDARAVFIIGVPFACVTETKVSLKKEYLDRRHHDPLDRYPLSGQEWYILNAIKAVNQAIGRIIRHKDDYGVIGLFDERFFVRAEIKGKLSLWAQETLQIVETWKEGKEEFQKFFEDKMILEEDSENSRNFDDFLNSNNLEISDFDF
jgi:Rad3-related DNA helicase